MIALMGCRLEIDDSSTFTEQHLLVVLSSGPDSSRAELTAMFLSCCLVDGADGQGPPKQSTNVQSS